MTCSPFKASHKHKHNELKFSDMSDSILFFLPRNQHFQTTTIHFISTSYSFRTSFRIKLYLSKHLPETDKSHLKKKKSCLEKKDILFRLGGPLSAARFVSWRLDCMCIGVCVYVYIYVIFIYTYVAILWVLFGMVKWLFKRLVKTSNDRGSNGHELNHLVHLHIVFLRSGQIITIFHPT